MSGSGAGVKGKLQFLGLRPKTIGMIVNSAKLLEEVSKKSPP